MTECSKNYDMISAYVDGELKDKEAEILIRHIENCKTCADLLTLYSEMSSAMDDIEESPPETLSKSIMADIRYESSKNDNRRKQGQKIWAVISAAVILIAVLGGTSVLRSLFSAGSSSDSNAVMEKTSEIVSEDFESFEEVYDESSQSVGEETAPGTSRDQATIIYNGHEVQVEADIFDELFTYIGQSSKMVSDEPVYTITINGENGEKKVYYVWVSDSNVLIETDETTYVSNITVEVFEDLLDSIGIIS